MPRGSALLFDMIKNGDPTRLLFDYGNESLLDPMGLEFDDWSLPNVDDPGEDVEEIFESFRKKVGNLFDQAMIQASADDGYINNCIINGNTSQTIPLKHFVPACGGM